MCESNWECAVQYIFASIVGNPEKEKKNVTDFVKLLYCVNEM